MHTADSEWKYYDSSLHNILYWHRYELVGFRVIRGATSSYSYIL